MLTKQAIATLSPEFSYWQPLVAPATGTVFGKSLRVWQKKVRETLSLPDNKPIIMVGHQPIFFHPGILIKFIAAQRLAQQVDGQLVFLVVDHHVGNNGVIQTPKENVKIATIDSSVAMKNHPRVTTATTLEPFTAALETANGANAAMQYANATVELMSPWVTVNHVVAAGDLLHSAFGNEIVANIQSNKKHCVDSYNNAVANFPESHVPMLQDGDLPLRKVGDEYAPRALLLTLLARLVGCDLFVHGRGGKKYDSVMEQWCKVWLGVSPCNATMATATIHLPMEYKTLTDARRDYYSPPFDEQTKKTLLDNIQHAPYKSPQRQIRFQELHRWLQSVQQPLDALAIKREEANAQRRDWAFPLYSNNQLDAMRDMLYAM